MREHHGGVVHEDVDAAERLLGLGGEGLHAGRVAEVPDDEDVAPAREVREGALGVRVPGRAVHRDPVPLLGEGGGDGPSDPPGGPGDEHPPARGGQFPYAVVHSVVPRPLLSRHPRPVGSVRV